MDRERIQIIVEVDIDPIPGWGNDPQDYVKMLEKSLSDRIPHYNPRVMLLDGIWINIDSKLVNGS